MKPSIAKLLATGAAICVMVLLHTGCELESADSHSISVSPRSATLNNGESVELVASGGYEYSWSLANESYGRLSARSGHRTIYTADYNFTGSNSVKQIVTLTSRYSENEAVTTTTSSSSGTNVNQNTNSGSATSLEVIITQKSDVVTEAESLDDVRIHPSSAVTLATGNSQDYQVTGGDGSYSWALSTGSYGYLSRDSGSTTRYTSSYTGSGEVSDFLVVSSAGQSFQVEIRHSSNPLTISPAGNLTLNQGDLQVFSASGGDGAYTWSLQDNALGTLSTTTGSQTTYTCTDDATTQVLSVTSDGLVAQVTIN